MSNEQHRLLIIAPPPSRSRQISARPENCIERADSLHVRVEDFQSEYDKLERRCRSAEREVAAQKELIEVSKISALYAVLHTRRFWVGGG